ncbi:hypothetical protein ES731_12550 [Psychroflexus gondwanensis]|uniref:Uncharacterized protein n=1 Tax=Psychroflexus gondwanensis ACAM 44 TaxID=1189619 RepID=N1WSQ6_9FLAO|nr:DUF6090 family protein [Psychroflexus gondwanensis]EMY80257.1 hypothetical protein pgond44_13007 [Psychroflexus gondwanensis ACAM 44]TXE17162.1 hypothetical protein ES731_12550 [Psychroflexus gondwanensis]
MIKFFRKIRYDLMEKNKTGKYLKYAIGEVVLVVIGILIALSINNWNESRIDRISEQAILRQLKSEFNSNLKQLDEKIGIRSYIINSAIQLLANIDNPSIRNIDSIEMHLAKTIPYTTFDPILNDLATSGNLRLIKNDSLRALLSVWTSEIVQVTEGEQTWAKYRNEIYIPFLIKNYQVRSLRNKAMKTNLLYTFLINQENRESEIKDIGNSKHFSDFNTLLDNPDYEDHLVRCITTNRNTQQQAFILRDRIVEILDILNKEIK